ncbi:hypothetical protein [Ruegeria sp. HKCCA6837]|uniref:hypothetical protein n=1 Tax=Ruegeria sp. HKCCA6837 TaxID=2682989 RepID=UPI00148960D8|nr:hypothetical protein [Ruegeria sp. HKCCA6837]
MRRGKTARQFDPTLPSSTVPRSCGPTISSLAPTRDIILILNWLMGTEHNSFEDRVARIRQRSDENAGNAPRPRAESFWRRLAYPGAFVGAFLLGIFAVFLTRYIQYQSVGIPVLRQVDTQDFVSLGLAGGACIMVMLFLKGKLREFASALAVGALLTTFTFHNLVWNYPVFFEQTCGEDSVDFVKDTTEPSSLNFFGTILPLG